MDNYLGPFDKAKDTAPVGGVTSGSPLLVGASSFRLPVADAAEGELYAYETAGRFTLVKATSTTFAVGDTVYWDNSAHKVTSNAAKLPIGLALKVAGSSATALDVVVYPCANTDVELTGKADLVADATAGNFAGLDADGNLTDSGSKPADFATVVASPTTGNFAGLDAGGDITDSGSKAADFAPSSAVTRMAGVYQITFTGGNSTGGNVTIAPTVKGTATPAVGDRILGIIGIVTSSNVYAGMPVIGTDFAALLLLDTTVKVQQKQAAGDLSLNTYIALVLPA